MNRPGLSSPRLSPVILVVLLLPACAGGPEARRLEFGPPHQIRSVMLEPGVELIRGGFTRTGLRWTAIRSRQSSRERRLAVVPEIFRDTGAHAPSIFGDGAVIASLNGSPHHPLRYRSGQKQTTLGFYRISGAVFSRPDGRHDAVGIRPDGRLVLLHPRDQDDWTGNASGGFYAVLKDGRPVSPVETRDAVSALGWSQDGLTLIFLAIEGRNGNGADYGEAGALLRDLGASTGLAMDGGGSVRLSWREDGGVKSFPPALLHRAVPNFLVIREYGDSVRGKNTPFGACCSPEHRMNERAIP